MNPSASQAVAAAGMGKKVPRTRKIARWVEHVLAIIGLCFVVYHFCFQYTVMTSDSMAPTLNGTSYENGDRILLEKLSHHLRAPKRWEIYFYYDSEGNPVAKRIVGMPGERISIRNNTVCVNGIPLPRPKNLLPVTYYAYGNLGNEKEVECGPGYFMLGDSSADSYDSRYTGIVTKERFQGRVWCILSPRPRAGLVN